mmetsp:Transcript_16466/g.28224  ORF Transcript_16466/g.28224 Transcript_16466/m.28224 type:complete len:351 (-) Transcript_16466:273-1325(-)
MSAADKISLEQRLAKLLSISIDDDRDYVTDVLDSLIDIGDPEDVAEYLSSFIAAGGDEGDEVGNGLQQFAQDVKKFKMGEDIGIVKENEKPPAAAANSNEAKPKAKILDEAAAQREEIKRRELEARERQREEQERMRRKKEEEEKERRRREAEAAKKKRQESQWGKKPAGQAQTPKESIIGGKKPPVDVKKKQPKASSAAAATIPVKQSNKRQTATTKMKPPPPEKGTPKNKHCGCFGNKHKPLTNCLRCGRISCEVEGINDYCHFCGYYIADAPSHTTTDTAQKHKERLLEFDRTSAARTQIHDDQEDYFVASTSMWATQEEQREAGQLEEERRKKLHERQKQVLNIHF